MKIKRVGWSTFLFTSENITILTDPVMLSTVGLSLPKTKVDVCLFSNYTEPVKESIIKDSKLESKIVPDKRESVMEINTPGEFEVGGLMIRRGIVDNFYIIDEKSVRIVYMGGTDNTFDPNSVKDIGDVDVLILPVGDGVDFMSFENIEKVLSNVDPAILIPCSYKESGVKNENVKSKEEFTKHFGFGNVKEESYLSINKKSIEEEQKSVEVIFLE
ncbi:MAG: MBL fold metallo-hydrolase [Candidatus Dojkabacteria bacterium]